MAEGVNIPVYIDIEGAFSDAAKRVDKASAPLRSSIEKLNKEMSESMQLMQMSNVNDELFRQAAKDVQLLSQALEVANDQFVRYSTNEGSLRRLNAELESLNRRWAEMGSTQKFTSSGKLTEDAEKLRAEYKKVTEEIKRSGKTLEKLAAEEERLIDLKNRGIRARRYENQILNSTVKTMRILREQERILTNRLQTQPVGSQKFQELSARLIQVREEMAKAEAQVRHGGQAYNKLGSAAAASTTNINAASAALTKQGGILKMLTSYVSGYALVFASIRFAHNVRETTAELEMQRVALGGILNDTERASELFRQIKAAALKSPFEIKDLVTYTKQLSAYRIETDKLFDVTMRLADVSAGLGVDMNRLILAYGQVRAASVLRGQELRQFTEAGIPLVELLAEKFQKLGREGTTTADVFELISKRAVPFSMIEDIFNDMTDAGEMFYKMQEKQSETLKGQWMKLRDSVTIMYNDIGNTKPVHDAMTTLIKTANDLTRSWREVANWAKALTTAVIAYKVAAKASAIATNSITKAEALRLAATKANTIALPKSVAALMSDTAAKKVSRFATRQLMLSQYKLATATTITTKAFWKLYAAIMANPYAAAAAAIVGLGMGILTIIKNSREAAISIDELESSVSKLKSTSSNISDAITLANSYETLANKAERSAEENKKLERVINELAKAFPAAVSGINSETGALEINIEKVKELSRAEYELELARIKRDKKRATSRKKELEAEKAAILERQQKGGYYDISDLSAEWHEFTNDELADMGSRLYEINEELKPLEKALGDIEEIIGELSFVGPEIPDSLKDIKDFTGWRLVLAQIQQEKKKAGAPQLFSKDDIEKMSTINDLWKDVKKGIKETEIELSSLENIQETLTDEKLKADNSKSIELTKKQLDLYNAIKETFGFVFGKESQDAYVQDPFIVQIQNRLKFMQDFKKGYDELSKYISSKDALSKVASKMSARGLSMGMSPSEQARAAEGLSQWYIDEMDRVFEQAKRHGAKGSIQEFLSETINDASKEGKAKKDFQKLLQTIFDAKTDFDISQLKDGLLLQMERIKNEIKRSEVARNFYQDIFSITGNEQLATNMAISIYGDIGSDFRENIQKQLNEAAKTINPSMLTDELKQALSAQDFNVILQNIDAFQPEWRKRIKEIADADQAFRANQAKELLKSLQKARSFSEKRIEIADQASRRLQQIEEMRISEAEKAVFRKRSAKKEAQDEAKLIYEAFKDTPMYIEVFANLDAASSRMLKNMRDNLDAMKDKWHDDLAPTELKELQSRLNELDRQLASRNPFKALITSIKDYREMTKKLSRAEADIAAINATNNAETQKELLVKRKEEYELAKRQYGVYSDEAAIAEEALEDQKEATDSAIEQADAAQETANAYRKAGQAIQNAASELKKWNGYITESLGGIKEIISTFADEDTTQMFDTIADGVGKTLSGTAELAEGIGRVMAGDATGVVDVIKGAGDVISGVFGTSNALKIQRINKQIEEQSRLINELEHSYSRLEKAMSKAFGSDYISNYNQEISTLQAQAAAYRRQAELEEDKGKKADEDKVREYLNSAREVEDQINDMKSQLSEFFTETDLSSAAKDFAQSWIEAYKEFGSTTDSIKQKFNDMIQNMVVNSLAAQLIQSILRPVFDAIDMASKDGALSAAEIAAVSAMVPERMQMIDDSMQSLMNQLTSAGVNLRQQVGGFTGISRDIAGATEESINGLAAGINTQNFYMQHIDANVAAILATLTGGTTTAASGTTGEYVDPYKDTMLLYAQHIPDIHDTLNSILSSLNSVIALNGTKKAIQVMM